MNKTRFLFAFIMMMFSSYVILNAYEVQTHTSVGGNGHELVYLDPPQVTYDEELNELTVYFGSTSTIDLECVDALGAYYYIYGEYHSGNTSTTYYYLPSGYYTVTIHDANGMTYIGSFTLV